MRKFDNLSKEEMLSILQTISMYIDAAEYEEIKPNTDVEWNDMVYESGFKSGVNDVCKAIRTFFGDK